MAYYRGTKTSTIFRICKNSKYEKNTKDSRGGIKIENTIINFINSNKDIVNLIGANRLFPLFTTDLKRPSLVYSYTPISKDYISQTQLEIKIIWNDYDKAKEIEECLEKIFINNESDSKFKTYKNITFKATRSGGGTLFRDDLQMFENSVIFIIKYKKG